MHFVTLCAHRQACVFGQIQGGEMRLSPVGQVVRECWERIPDHFPQVHLDASVVMPNHIHGLLLICDEREREAQHGREHVAEPIMGSLGTIVRSFKSAVTKRVNELRDTPGGKLWQVNYFEHIVRNDRALERIRSYIESNPASWELDRENHERRGVDEFDRLLERGFREHRTRE
jgi:REP element-mobilizing transposase RayT